MQSENPAGAKNCAIQIAKTICANPSNSITPCKETAEDLFEFIQTLAEKLEGKFDE